MPPVRIQLATALTMAALCFAPQTSAHFIFLELKDDSVAMRFSEAPGEETEKELQEKAKPMAVKTDSGTAVTMAFGEDALSGTVAAEIKAVSGSLDYGVLDRGSQGRGVFMLVYHAKGVRSLAEAATKLGLPVEVIAEAKEGQLEIQVLRDGAPAAGAELTLSIEGKEDLELNADEMGKAKVALPEKGTLGIRAMVREEKAGEADGKAYTFVRHYSTLTFTK